MGERTLPFPVTPGLTRGPAVLSGKQVTPFPIAALERAALNLTHIARSIPLLSHRLLPKTGSRFLARRSKSGPATPAARRDNLCAAKRRRAGMKGRIAVYPARFSPAGGRGRQMPLADANRYGSRGGDGTAHLRGGGDMGPLERDVSEGVGCRTGECPLCCGELPSVSIM